jgi:hypothetical protein
VIVLTSLLRRLPHLSPEEFRTHHRERHAPLFAATPAARRHVRRYTIDHPEPNWTPGLPDTTFDAVVRMWFAGRKDLVAMFASPSYWKTIRPDEKRFFSYADSEFYLAQERIIIGATGARDAIDDTIALAIDLPYGPDDPD